MEKVYLTKQAYVYAELHRRINAGELKPGDWLSPQALAEEFGVSPIPVREALKQLERDDLVEMQPHRRGVVKGITPQEAVWIAHLRTILEPEAVRDAVPRIDQHGIAELARHLEDLGNVMDNSDQAEFSRINKLFHGCIVSYCSNRRLVSLLGSLADDATRFSTFKRYPERLRESQDSHRKIFEAVKGGDSDGAAEETRLHRQRVQNRLHDWFDL